MATYPTPTDTNAWRALRDLPRSKVPSALVALAAERGVSARQLRERLITIYGHEAELLPEPVQAAA